MIISDKMKDGVMEVKHEIKGGSGYLKSKKQGAWMLPFIFEIFKKVKES